MIIENQVQTETNCNVPGIRFGMEASDQAFDILSRRLYANPELAVVRELISNAWDSHVAAGRTDVPVRITLPTRDENQFIVEDSGTGMSEEECLTLYTTFFKSSKQASNDYTGCFGLGSKSPFAVAEAFSVVSRYNGTEYRFACIKKDGYPHIIKLSECPTSEHNGVKVSVPIPEHKTSDICFEYSKYIMYMSNMNIECMGARPCTPSLKLGNLSMYHSIRGGENGQLWLRQGSNIFRLNKDHIGTNLASVLSNCTVVIDVEVGTVQMTPSREQITEQSYTAVHDIFQDIETLLNICVRQDYEKWIGQIEFEWLVLKEINAKYFNPATKFELRWLRNGEVSINSYYSTSTLFTLKDRRGVDTQTTFGPGSYTVVVGVPSEDKKVTRFRDLMSEREKYRTLFICRYTGLQDSLKTSQRERIKKLIATFRQLEKLDFLDMKFRFITLNKWRKEQRKSIPKAPKPEVQYLKYRPTEIWDFTGDRESIFRCSPVRTDTPGYVRSRFSHSNTLVYQTFVKGQSPELYLDVLRAMMTLKDVEGRPFVRDILTSVYGVPPSGPLCFLGISKGRMKEFEDYKAIDPADILAVILNQNWKYAQVACFNPARKEDIDNFAMTLNPNVRRAIFESNLYKAYEVMRRQYAKYNCNGELQGTNNPSNIKLVMDQLGIEWSGKMFTGVPQGNPVLLSRLDRMSYLFDRIGVSWHNNEPQTTAKDKRETVLELLKLVDRKVVRRNTKYEW